MFQTTNQKNGSGWNPSKDRDSRASCVQIKAGASSSGSLDSNSGYAKNLRMNMGMALELGTEQFDTL